MNLSECYHLPSPKKSIYRMKSTNYVQTRTSCRGLVASPNLRPAWLSTKVLQTGIAFSEINTVSSSGSLGVGLFTWIVDRDHMHPARLLVDVRGAVVSLRMLAGDSLFDCG